MSLKNKNMMKPDNIPEDSIQVSDFDPNFRYEVMRNKDAQQLSACFACGACTAGCPIHEVFYEFDPRKLAKMVQLGMKNEVLHSPYIWYCATCHNCEQRCPQNVKFFNILNVLKNMAAQKGYAPYAWVVQTKNIMQTGIVFRTNEAWEAKRKSRSLPDLKLDGEKVKKIIEISDLDKIEAKKRL